MALYIVYDAAAAVQEQTIRRPFLRKRPFRGLSSIFGAARKDDPGWIGEVILIGWKCSVTLTVKLNYVPNKNTRSFLLHFTNYISFHFKMIVWMFFFHNKNVLIKAVLNTRSLMYQLFDRRYNHEIKLFSWLFYALLHCWSLKLLEIIQRFKKYKISFLWVGLNVTGILVGNEIIDQV